MQPVSSQLYRLWKQSILIQLHAHQFIALLPYPLIRQVDRGADTCYYDAASSEHVTQADTHSHYAIDRTLVLSAWASVAALCVPRRL